jgi:integrase
MPRDTPKGARDAALILLGFASALRRSELTELTLADVETMWSAQADGRRRPCSPRSDSAASFHRKGSPLEREDVTFSPAESAMEPRHGRRHLAEPSE